VISIFELKRGKKKDKRKWGLGSLSKKFLASGHHSPPSAPIGFFSSNTEITLSHDYDFKFDFKETLCCQLENIIREFLSREIDSTFQQQKEEALKVKLLI